MKRVISLFFLCCLVSFLSAEEIDYGQFKTFEELIQFETAVISHAEINNDPFISECYLNRGESYLLDGQIDKALEDFQKGRELQAKVFTIKDQEKIEFRSLLGMSISLAILNEAESVYALSPHLQNLLNSWQCDDCLQLQPCKDEEYVTGPDQEPYKGWCQDSVEKTSAALQDLICFVPKMEVQLVLRRLIDNLEAEGLRCCARGSGWKTCVGPLAKKLSIWEQKWKLLNVPPDPTWD